MKRKSRGNGQGSVYPRNGAWVAQVVIGFRPASAPGKSPVPIKRTKTFATKKEAVAYCPVLLASGAQEKKQAPRLLYYWDIYSRNEYMSLSKSKQTAYRIAWNKLKPIHDMRVDLIAVQDLRDAVTAACPTYYPAKDCKNLLSNLFNLAGADGFVNKDLPSYIILPQLEEKAREIFTHEEQASLWKLYESGDKNACIPLLMIYTGMMPGEAMALKKDHIDLESRTITGVGMKTKARKVTPIVLSSTIIPVIEDLIANAQPSGYIFKRSEDEWYAAYYDALSKANCRRLPPYSCRHTTATALAISENIAPQTIRKIMRWSTSKMLDRYAHPDTSDALTAVDTLQK